MISITHFQKHKKYSVIYLDMKYSHLQQLTSYLTKISNLTSSKKQLPPSLFKPTSLLAHPFLQSIYNIAEPVMPFEMKREKIFFEDGGHIALDWTPHLNPKSKPPILFIMHGLTGGSEMNYIRVMMSEAYKENYQCVCLNSRGINTEMTSPIPFAAITHNELRTALERVQYDYPQSDIYMLGTSFGGNYLLRYLINQKRPSIKGLVVLAPPLNVAQVVDDMPGIYQRFFVKRYIHEVVTRHPQMQYWEDIGLVDMEQVRKSRTLREYHDSLSAKILGYKDAQELFDQYHISAEQINSLDVKTLFMLSKDDPIVSYSSMPIQSIRTNENIKFITTQKGGHLCWFSGAIPKRWYPKPVLQFLGQLQQNKEYLPKQESGL